MAGEYDSQHDLTIKVLTLEGTLALTMTFPPRETISIGRSSESDVWLANFGQHISRCHAAILNDGDHWEYYSLGVNGTFRDGSRIDMLTIKSGLSLRLGKSGPILQFSLPEPECS